MNLFGFLVCTLFVVEGYAARNYGMCPPIAVPNGRVRYRQRGKIARFMCNTGFMVAGDRYTVCLGGKWDNTISKCVRASCKIAKPPTNGLIYPSYGGAVLNFYCKSGFELRGANITYCDGVKWDNPLPACLPTSSTPPLSCDFESENLCGWNHDLNHDFDWKRLNYATPSGTIGTGPSYDHTKGPGNDGYYMYIESSARRINDTARLISPVYDRSDNIVCFEFYYHMYGVTMGSLRIYLKKINETWNLEPKYAIFNKSGNQGNKWYRGFAVLGSVDTDYQIVIEGVRGFSYVSDIAIDDVRIIKDCVPDNEMEEETTTEESATSELPISVESCKNRCTTFDNQSSFALITCDCDDGCFVRNRCCPDYFDFCISGTTDDFMEETTDDVNSVTETTTPKSTTSIKITTKIHYFSTTVHPTTTNVPKITKVSKTTTRIFTPPKSTIVPKTTPRAKTTLLPKKKPTTSTTNQPPTTGNLDKKDGSKIIYVKPNEDYDDILVTPLIEDETPETPIKETEIINDYESDKTFDHHKIEVIADIHETNTKTIIFAVGVVFGVLFALVGMAFVAKRYQLCHCKRIRLNQSSNGDSQSDVRFLTSDEVINFSLPSDYDTL